MMADKDKEAMQAFFKTHIAQNEEAVYTTYYAENGEGGYCSKYPYDLKHLGEDSDYEFEEGNDICDSDYEYESGDDTWFTDDEDEVPTLEANLRIARETEEEAAATTECKKPWEEPPPIQEGV